MVSRLGIGSLTTVDTCRCLGCRAESGAKQPDVDMSPGDQDASAVRRKHDCLAAVSIRRRFPAAADFENLDSAPGDPDAPGGTGQPLAVRGEVHGADRVLMAA